MIRWKILRGKADDSAGLQSRSSPCTAEPSADGGQRDGDRGRGAFLQDAHVMRKDILEELNRLSSAVHYDVQVFGRRLWSGQGGMRWSRQYRRCWKSCRMRD